MQSEESPVQLSPLFPPPRSPAHLSPQAAIFHCFGFILLGCVCVGGCVCTCICVTQVTDIHIQLLIPPFPYTEVMAPCTVICTLYLSGLFSMVATLSPCLFHIYQLASFYEEEMFLLRVTISGNHPTPVQRSPFPPLLQTCSTQVCAPQAPQTCLCSANLCLKLSIKCYGPH